MLAQLICRLIRVYQYGLSPFLGPRCRFSPSCSEYAAEAFSEHGLFLGGWLAARRICRCHPWNVGGLDQVPRHPSKPEQAPEAALNDSNGN